MSTTPALAFAAYIRTSTDDQQSPEDSKRWQLDTATRLVVPAGGVIVATYHDIDVTRELPWARRPEASRVLADAANPARGWTALVIAEPQRAFSGGQFQLVFPQLTHYGIELWVPELGGRIDPDSEGHEMLMGLFGGLSKAERQRRRDELVDPMDPASGTTNHRPSPWGRHPRWSSAAAKANGSGAGSECPRRWATSAPNRSIPQSWIRYLSRACSRSRRSPWSRCTRMMVASTSVERLLAGRCAWLHGRHRALTVEPQLVAGDLDSPCAAAAPRP